MNCEKCLNLLDDLFEGELGEQIAAEVDRHVFSCRCCAAEFEILTREKRMYAHFLFEIEPPSDLPEQFRANLDSAGREGSAFAPPRSNFNERLVNLCGAWNFKAVLTSVAVLLVFGAGFFWLNRSADHSERTFVLDPQIAGDKLPVNSQDTEFTEKKPDQPLPESVKAPDLVPVKRDPSGSKTKAVAVSAAPLKKTVIHENKPQISAPPLKLSREDELQLKQIQAFETETAKQLEKVEMLLRSFRNARVVEGCADYDISYEKEQARKLLEKNVALRRQAENYGTLLTGELLGRVEPYLLEISNLDNNPSTEDVLEIKQRVKNQNIIASLQGF
jgi:hypothetical protein